LDLATSNRSVCPNPSRRKKSTSPLLQAFIVQCGVFFFTAIVSFLIQYSFGWILPLYLFLLIHCSLSSIFIFLIRGEWWWCLIQFLFPVALAFGLYFQLPPWISFCSFSVLFVIFGSTLRTRVPYYPSSSVLPELLLKIIPNSDRDLCFLDVGSGFAGLLFGLSKLRSRWKLCGVEVAILPWMVSKLKIAICRQKNVSVKLQDYERLNFSDFDIVFAYLSPVVMSDVWSKAMAEMRPGSIFVSYEFSVLDQEPSFVFPVDCEGCSLYVWHI